MTPPKTRQPGGWPTGPLMSPGDYDRRDLCNALDDVWCELVRALRVPQIAEWLARRVE